MNHHLPPAEADMHWIEPMHDGSFMRIRHLTPDDCQRERAFLSHLTSDQRSNRFIGLVKPIDDAVVSELTCDDPAREITLAAFTVARDGGEEVEIGVARYCSDEQGLHCDCSVAVDPMWQKRGVGRALMLRLIEVARARGIRRMYAVGDSGQAGARSLAEWLGFHSRPDPEDPHVTAYELVINP